MDNVTPRPLFTPGKDPVPIVQEAGWAPGSVLAGAENLAYDGIRSSDRPARIESLHRLSNPGPRSPDNCNNYHIFRTENNISQGGVEGNWLARYKLCFLFGMTEDVQAVVILSKMKIFCCTCVSRPRVQSLLWSNALSCKLPCFLHTYFRFPPTCKAALGTARDDAVPGDNFRNLPGRSALLQYINVNTDPPHANWGSP